VGLFIVLDNWRLALSFAGGLSWWDAVAIPCKLKAYHNPKRRISV